jgi:hypothetical protein
MTTRTITLRNPQQGHKDIASLWCWIKAMLTAGHELVLTVKPATRSTEQNRRLWALLTEVSQQVEWYGKRLTPEDWKHVFTASLRKLDVVPNLDGTGFVALGMSTSRMTVAEMGDLMTLIEAFGAQRGVRFADERIDAETGEILCQTT